MRYALLLVPLAMFGAGPAIPQAPAVINVQLSSFKFTPRTIVLDHGRAYLMRFHNASKDGHDFSAPAFFAASRIAPEDRRMIMEGEVEVHPGMTPRGPADRAGRRRALQGQVHPQLPQAFRHERDNHRPLAG